MTLPEFSVRQTVLVNVLFWVCLVGGCNALRLTEVEYFHDVTLNSIISVKPGSRSVEKGNDGVVEYTSAHLDGAESELVVRHGHSCTAFPATILELRRILLVHAPD